MAKTKISHPNVLARETAGLEARSASPLTSHEGWTPARDRPDPVALLEIQDESREPDLVPVRHGRMSVSPFTFYRGATARSSRSFPVRRTDGEERTESRHVAA